MSEQKLTEEQKVLIETAQTNLTREVDSLAMHYHMIKGLNADEIVVSLKRVITRLKYPAGSAERRRTT